MAKKKRNSYNRFVDEGRKRVLLIAAAILDVRKLAQCDGSAWVPSTITAVDHGITWAERILQEIDRRWPTSNKDRYPQKL